MKTVHQAIKAKLLKSVHDISEGGLAIALSEMCIGGNLGAKLDLSQYEGHTLTTFLFAESPSRFIVELSPENEETLKTLFADIPFERIGTVIDSAKLEIQAKNEQIMLDVSALETAWHGEVSQTYESPVIKSQKTIPTISAKTSKPRVLIMHANGTNRDREAALACELAGGDPEIVHINQLLKGERDILDYQMLLIPGGFSYGDDLGAGVLWALDMQTLFKEQVSSFIESGRPVLGICNGFQTLVKSKLLPGIELEGRERLVTLTHNESSKFECRWVYLQANPNNNCIFTDGLDELIYCPVAHGEGRIAVRDDESLQRLWDDGLVALTYVNADGSPASYPNNPNGSAGNIAGLTNHAGNVMGLMPHPEDHIFSWQHPRWHRQESGNLGLWLFKNAIKNA
jgi:phosphoribosylformylglycinamidine synthase